MANDVLIMNTEYMTTLAALCEEVKIKMPGRMVHMGTRTDMQILTIRRNVIGWKSVIWLSSVFSYGCKQPNEQKRPRYAYPARGELEIS
jgi:hypothetical protein